MTDASIIATNRTDAEICAKAIELIDAYKTVRAEYEVMKNDIHENGFKSKYFVAEGDKFFEMAKAHEDCTKFIFVEVFERGVNYNQLDEIIFSANADALKDMVREYMGC